MTKKRVLIIGGGYGGIRALEHLYQRDDLNITLIDQNNYHYLQTEAYGFIANRISLTDITISLPTLAAQMGVGFYKKKVSNIDSQSNRVIFDDESYLEFDYLIIAAGSRTHFPSNIEGIKEYAHGIKSLKRAFEFRQKFEQIVYNEIRSKDGCSIEDFNVVIAGAGLSGVEIAAEMAEYSHEILYSSGFFCGDINIYLISSSDTVLSGMDSFLIEKSAKKLNRLGVKVLYNDRVVNLNENEVVLESGKKLVSNFLIWTAGIYGSPFIRNLSFEKNTKNQLLVDEFLRVKNFKNIFSIGDCAELRTIDNKIIPPTAQSAELSAEICARNIKHLIDNKPLEKANIKTQGLLIAIGGKDGVALLFDKIRLSGKKAYYMKEFIFSQYKNPLKNRCKSGFNKLYEEK
jgi:NADH dehydrogenase